MALGKIGTRMAILATVFAVLTGAVDKVAKDVGIGEGIRAKAAVLTFTGTDLISGELGSINLNTTDVASDSDPSADGFSAPNSIGSVSGAVDGGSFAQQGTIDSSTFVADISAGSFKMKINDNFSGGIGSTGTNVFSAEIEGDNTEDIFTGFNNGTLSFFFTKAMFENADTFNGIAVKLFGQENNVIANILVSEMTWNGSEPVSVGGSTLSQVPIPGTLPMMGAVLTGIGLLVARRRTLEHS